MRLVKKAEKRFVIITPTKSPFFTFFNGFFLHVRLIEGKNVFFKMNLIFKALQNFLLKSGSDKRFFVKKRFGQITFC